MSHMKLSRKCIILYNLLVVDFTSQMLKHRLSETRVGPNMVYNRAMLWYDCASRSRF